MHFAKQIGWQECICRYFALHLLILYRGVGSFLKVGGQDQKLFQGKQKFGGQMSLFNKSQAKKWVGT